MLKRYFKLSAFVIALLMVFSALVGPASAPQAQAANHKGSDPASAKEIQRFADQFFKKEMEKRKIPGAVFVVVKDNKVLFQKGYGYSDVEKGVKMDPENTVFRAASVGKVFTATAVMQLVEQGKIDLNEDVNNYLGDIQLKNNVNEPVTMKHLLSFTTGFDNPDKVNPVSFNPNERRELRDIVIEGMPTVVRKPGESYMYDNYASMLQGYIVQNLSGISYHQYMDQHIFLPLGMKNSNILMTPQIEAKLATGYDIDGKTIAPYTVVPAEAPQGSMFTSASDMTKFMLAQLNNGKLGNNRILKPKSTKEMQKIHFAVHSKVPNMGYGFETFFHASHNGQKVIGKGGDLPGAHSWMWLLPKQKLGAFVFYNKDEENWPDMRGQLFAEFMDRFYPEKEERPTYLKPALEELRRFEGTYRDLRIPEHWATKITASPDGTLIVEDAALGKHIVRQMEPLLFEDEDGNPLAFRENEDGTIGYLYYANPFAMAKKIE
ncbi:serine hydrolase domain-containing protein [Sporosarcina globispora]|uniref:serine hydrolase domain-containing protein n=1 Tax=Sporosarcina globispora TaxID=1459 RepID=UPI0006A9FD11|nr:serine hydrolase domain-containing protein [Sporosarcina globispora]